MIINFKEERETNTELVKKYHSIGLYYSKIGKTKKAIEFFKKVLNINPNHLDSKNKIKVLIKRMENNEKKKKKNANKNNLKNNYIYSLSKRRFVIKKSNQYISDLKDNVIENSKKSSGVENENYLEEIKAMSIVLEKYYAKYDSVVTIYTHEFSIREIINLDIVNKRSDIFYKCTSKNIVLVKWIIDETKKMFNKVDNISLLFPSIYSQLRVCFKNLSMNRQNLKKLLHFRDAISFKDFSKIAENYENIYDKITDPDILVGIRKNKNPKTSIKMNKVMFNYIANSVFREDVFLGINTRYNSNFNEDEMELCKKLQDAKQHLGKENCMIFLKNKELTKNIYNVSRLLIKTIDEEKKYREIIDKIDNNITENIKNAKIYFLIDAYTSNNDNKILKDIFNERKCFLVREIQINNLVRNFLKTEKYLTILDFLQWLSNIKEETLLNKFVAIFKNKRDKTIFKKRAMGNTLEKAADQYGITRERVRQLESKIIRSFIYYVSRVKPHYVLLALTENENTISEDLVEKIYGEYSEEFKYALKKANIKNINFNEKLKAFVFDDMEWQELVELYINDLPEMIECKQTDNVLKPIFYGTGFPVEYNVIKKIVLSKYQIIGNYYSRTKISNGELYLAVVKKYYPNGIKLFDEFETKRFKIFAENMFGNVNWPDTDRAVSARIAERTVLCDRGKYILPKYIRIDVSLLKEIHDFIKNSVRNKLLFHELYKKYEEKLLKYSNINNRYFLQGVLKYKYNNEFMFDRDTVAENIKNSQSIGDEIESFIKSKKFITTKNEIEKEFLGITEIMINLHTTGNNNILLWGLGKYIHISKLKLEDNVISRLSNMLSIYTKKNAVSVRKIFDDIYSQEKKLIFDNHIENHIALFSLLEYLFKEKYKFSKPYITSKNSTIITSDSIIREFLSGFDKLTISELKYFIDDNHIKIMNFSNLIDHLSNQFIRVDRNLLIRKDKLNLSSDIINKIEETLLAIMGTRGYISARLFDDFLFFPSLVVKWTPYLLVSIIRTLGKKIKVLNINTDYRYLKDIFVSARIEINDYEELLHYAIKTEHNNKEFKNVNEIKDFIKNQNLIFNKIPKSLFKKGYLVEDEYGEVKVM